MKKHWVGIAFILALCLVACAFAQENSQVHMLRPYGKQGNPAALAITYYGGPVFETAPTVYIVYYGKWTTKDRKVIDTFFANLSGTSMNKINTTYSDNNNKFIPNAVNYDPTTDSYHDNYSLGKTIRDAQVQQIIANAISKGKLPNDQNGIYFSLLAADVADPDGQCTSFCGYHSPSRSIVSGEIIKYSMVGNPARCPSGCEASAVIGDSNSPNNDPGADGTVNIMWHEYSESDSDPNVGIQTAWNGGPCGENGDCCAWQFGTLKVASNGSHYNEKIGGKHYITQMMLKLSQKKRGNNIPGTCENTYNHP